MSAKVIELLRRVVKWTMLWVFALGSVRRYFALRGAITLAATRSFPEPALATVEPITTPHQVRKISLIRLDDLADEISACNFIKVDVEGHEAAFLRGALGVIEKHRPLIQIESNDIVRDAAEYRAYAEKSTTTFAISTRNRTCGPWRMFVGRHQQLLSCAPGMAPT